MLCYAFLSLKPMTLWMDHAKLLDVLMSLPVSHAILPRAVCFATSRLANHSICSFIDSSGYASGPIRICLFIDYIINMFNIYLLQFLLHSKFHYLLLLLQLNKKCLSHEINFINKISVCKAKTQISLGIRTLRLIGVFAVHSVRKKESKGSDLADSKHI